MRNSRFNFCDCPAGFEAVPERHAPDCPGRSGAGKAPTPVTKPLKTQPEFEPDGLCVEDDGCPTEGAVLKRFWRANKAAADFVDELNAEVESLKAQLEYTKERNTMVSVQRNEHAHEVNTLREVLTLLAPDLKAMAILYAQRGDHERSQALNNIAKSVGL